MSYTRLQALTQSAGEALTAFCGAQMTRLTQKAEAGDATLVCERLAGWPTVGTVQVDGIVYNYASRTDAALGTLSVATPNGVLSGVQTSHALAVAVLDVSRSTSGLDLLRRSIFVGTAIGNDLTVVGRNLGVARNAAVTDDEHYRAIIKAIAYNPRTTMYGLELALDAMLGAGNYTIAEPFIAKPATVSVNVSSATFLAQLAQGNTYVDGRTQALATSATEIDLPGRYLAVSGLQLQDDILNVDCRTQKPSQASVRVPGGTQPAFVFVGDESQVKLVQLGAGAGAIQIQSAQGYYQHTANLGPAATLSVSCVFGIPPSATLSATDARNFAVRICDGATAFGFGCVASGTKVGIGLCNPLAQGSGALIAGVAASFAKGVVVDVSLAKTGAGNVALRVNGQLVQTAPLSAFPSATVPSFDFGALGATAANGVVRFVRLYAHTPTDFMGAQSSQAASMSGLVLTDNAQAFKGTEYNLPVRVYGAVATNNSGGRNNGAFLASFYDAHSLLLRGVPHASGAQVIAGNTLSVTGHASAFAYPDDMGKTVTVYNSQSGNNGTFAIVGIVQNGTGRNFASLQSPVVGHGRTCLLAGAHFAAETNIGWQLNPAGITESGLSYALSGAGTVSVNSAGQTSLAPQRPLPYPNAIYSAQASQEYSAIVVDSELPVVSQVSVGPPPTFNIAPAYVNDTSNYVKSYLTDLVAAGVRLELNYV